MSLGGDERRLTPEEWGAHYNIKLIDGLVASLKSGEVNVQTLEIMKHTKPGDKVLEIGAGSGASSLYLAMHGRIVSALDNSKECIVLIDEAAKRLQVKVETVFLDAEKDLPYPDKHFDVIFHAGLLEHFESGQRVTLLKNWGRVTKKMISLVPNGSSMAYRIGKIIQERTGQWSYGVEHAIYTQSIDFNAANINVQDEYTVGVDHSFHFLPKYSWLHVFFRLIKKFGYFDKEIYNQGYLLVTVGACK